MRVALGLFLWVCGRGGGGGGNTDASEMKRGKRRRRILSRDKSTMTWIECRAVAA